MTIACLIKDDFAYGHVRDLLAKEGWDCMRFTAVTALLRHLCHNRADLALIDTGSDLAAEERVSSWLSCRTGESTPVVLLSSAPLASRVARALDAGVEDFIARPVDPVELVARVRSVLRRHRRRVVRLPSISLAGYELDRANCRAMNRGVPVQLTTREFCMAWLFFSNPGSCLSRTTISTAVWGVGADIANRTMEQHVYKLRKKLGFSDQRGVTIRTAYAQGYRLEIAAVEELSVPTQRSDEHRLFENRLAAAAFAARPSAGAPVLSI